MCGILGLWNTSGKDVRAAMSLLQARGNDGAGWTDGEEVQHAQEASKLTLTTTGMGHTLHAIVDHQPQPIKKEGVLVANCEIYNWRALAEKHHVKAENDAALLCALLDKIELVKESVHALLEELDGVYAFAYRREGRSVIARDLLGVKPLWYTHQDGFSYASERKALLALGHHDVNELDPRTILHYDEEKNRLRRWRRPFYDVTVTEDDEASLATRTKALLVEAIRKRVPDRNIQAGILFSGGIDSTIIAKTCKDLGVKATCYTAVAENPRGKEPHDLVTAKEVAAKHRFKHEVVRVDESNIPQLAEETANLIEEAHAVKVAVGMPFLAAAKQARKDGCKVLFSGLGAEELYAGYQRHKHAQDVNDECYAGLLWLYERDLYRDDVITMRNGLELRLPFLDKELTKQALTIPGSLKLKDGKEKYLLRKAALLLGIDEQDAFRPKKAAQYGSGFDRALERVARSKGESRSQYLRAALPNANRKLGILCSGGKDSWYAAYVTKRLNYDLACVMTMRSENQDSYLFHTPAVELVKLQARAAELPYLEQSTKGEKEEELEDLKALLQKAKEEHQVEGVVTGALRSQYQRSRFEQACDELGLKAYAPLWHLEQESELRELLREGFVVTMSSIAGEGLSEEWLGRAIGEKEVEVLVRLRDKIGFNVAGEGGEYESLVLDCPLFKKRLMIQAKREMENSITGRITVTKAFLAEK
ncbi:diphthine--ammonia ligase [Candidatus Woesearchaeota archaeon]|nr:diphthine--ammonia ligase [Candidatus Woesearchaeota archaeon]